MPTGDPPLTLRELRAIDLARLKGVGDTLTTKLAEMDLHNVLDLLQHYPRRWIDRTKRVEIAALEVGEEATVKRFVDNEYEAYRLLFALIGALIGATLAPAG